MDRTPNLDMPFILPSQAQKHVTHNEALWRLDALVQLAVLDRDLTAAPATPSEGERYLVASGATGDWAGWDLDIACYSDGAWVRHVPGEGWVVWVEDEEIILVRNGGTWVDFGEAISNLQNLALVGVGTTADVTNPLAAKLNNILLTARYAGEGGDGDLRIKANKETTGDMVSYLFQTGYSGRPEFGLTGDDNFAVKVSPDGSSWTTGIVVSKDNGYAGFGTSLPHAPMHSGGAILNRDYFGNNLWFNPSFARWEVDTVGYGFTLRQNGYGSWDIWGCDTASPGATADIKFIATFNHGGFLGIGTAFPITLLDIRAADASVEGGEVHLRGAGSYRDWNLDVHQDRFRIGSTDNANLTGFQDRLTLDDTIGQLIAAGTVRSSSYTVATLPSAATHGAGARTFVTNANATTFNSVVAGGGSNKVPVFSDGTNWRIG